MSKQDPTIIYTHTDEAPALATYSFLPILRAFAGHVGIAVETRDISLGGRILATFPERLTPEQRVADALAELGEMALDPEANIIKLPNISASLPQLKAAIEELQGQGYDVPDLPEEPSDDAAREIAQRYERVRGSAVNPVLRQGNSDRRAPKAVKEYARRHPHRMGKWSADSKTHVSTMTTGDFFANERSVTMGDATTLRVELVNDAGDTTVLADELKVAAGEVVDGTFMSKAALTEFLREQVADAKAQGVLFSLHMKATMMKVSDPLIFGHAVRAYFADLFDKHGETFEKLGVDVTSGFADVIDEIEKLPEAERKAVQADIEAIYAKGPGLAMVDSDRGITNLHRPNDVIIDASMPAMIRTSGQMWNAAGGTDDAKAVIPDSSYAGLYQVVIDDCKARGAYDPTTMGSVSNVGLMAKKAEEYGSHGTTYEIAEAGKVRVVDGAGEVLIEHAVQPGDIWRLCRVKDGPVRDWVKLAVNRARASSTPAVFWLDEARAHDAQLIKKVRHYLGEHDTNGLQIEIMSPVEATRFSLDRIREGKDTISVTGNVLRDYLTDLFPILEVGTSAKMLSIVPLMNGGGLFETGAGGSAPKHVQQFVKEGHLRWDSLGEFLALACSLEHVAERHDHAAARVLGTTLDDATTKYLLENKSPSRKVNELDNRGSHYYLACFWARALAEQDNDARLAQHFAELADALEKNEATIIGELEAAQGSAVDIGGYYQPDPKKCAQAMRPSQTLNELLA